MQGGTGMPAIRSVSPTSPIRRPFTAVGAGKGIAPTSPSDPLLPNVRCDLQQFNKQWPTLVKRAAAEAHLATFYGVRSSLCEGVKNRRYTMPSFDLWKKCAKNSELELRREQDRHRADNAKNHTLIHRVSRRLIPLEKALGKAKDTIKHQEKIITYLKGQLMATNEKKLIEVSYFRSQADVMQQRLVGATQTNEQKILELQEELRQADLRAGTLQAQVTEIYRNVDEASDVVNVSGSGRGGTPASPSSDGGRGGKRTLETNDQDMGLVALSRITRMHLLKQHLKEKLKNSEEQIMLLMQENERLRKLAQEAVNRSNKFLDLAQTMNVDRDLTMSRLKEAEDVIQSLHALKDVIHLYSVATSPRLGNFFSGSLVNKAALRKREASSTEKEAADGSQSDTADLETMKGGGTPSKPISSKDDGGPGARSIGPSLLNTLQSVFQVLANKVETANHTAKVVKQEREEIRVKMLEAFQLLRGQKGSKLDAANDIALGVLMAVREMKETLEGLKKERALLKASESVEDDRLVHLQSQVHDLSMDRMALLETLEVVKNTIRASNSGQGVLQYLKGFSHKRVIQGKNISEVLEMVDTLVREKYEAKSIGGTLKNEKLLKEKEISDLTKLYAQSQTLTAHLQAEKDLLKKERNDLRAACETLRRQRPSWDAEKKAEGEKEILDLQGQIHDMVLEKTALSEAVKAIRTAVRLSKAGQGSAEQLKRSLGRTGNGNLSEIVEIMEELLTDMSDARQLADSVMVDKEKRKGELDEIMQLYGQSRDMCAKLEEERRSLQCEYNKLQTSVDAWKSGSESHKKELDESRNLCAILEEEKSRLQTQFHELQGRFDALKLKKVSAERESDGLKRLHIQSEEQRNSIQNDFSMLQRTVDALRTEKESIHASSGEMEKGISELQIQLQNATKDNAALLDALTTLRNVLREADLTGATEHSEELLGSLDPRNVFELLKMSKRLVNERNAARSAIRHHEQENEVQSREIIELKHLYSQSISMCGTLQSTKDELEREVKGLQNTFRSIQGSICEVVDDPHSPGGSLTLETMVNEVTAIKEKLHAAEDEISHDREAFERAIGEMSQVVGKQEHPNDWKSGASSLIAFLKVLKTEKEQLAASLTDCQEFRGLQEYQVARLFQIMLPDENEAQSHAGRSEEHPSNPSEPLTSREGTTASSTALHKDRRMAQVIAAVKNLKREHVELMERLHSTVLEKEVAVRRSSEHESKMQKLSDCSQQEVNELRHQLNAVQSFVISVLPHGTSLPTQSPDGRVTNLSRELAMISDELVTLRKDKANLEIRMEELTSKGDTELARVNDLLMKLSSAETQVQNLSARALSADALESQYAAAEDELSELFGMLSVDRVLSSSAGRTSTSEALGPGALTKIKAIQSKVEGFQRAREEEVSKRTREANKWKAQLEAVEREGKMTHAEAERLREKLSSHGEFIKKHTAEWTKLVDNLKNEIFRLGGSDPKDEGEKLRRATAAAKVKELIAPALLRNPQTSQPQTSTDALASSNALLNLGTFQVDLLVNSKVHSQLKLSGHNGGLCQAVLQYFYVDAQTGDITFENARIPGSQSSNLVVDLIDDVLDAFNTENDVQFDVFIHCGGTSSQFLLPVDAKREYYTKAGDTLGLCIKVSTLNEASPREVLFNTSIVRTDEVLRAIQGQTIQNFSLWPDLVSSWRWERDANKNRSSHFLFKVQDPQ